MNLIPKQMPNKYIKASKFIIITIIVIVPIILGAIFLGETLANSLEADIKEDLNINTQLNSQITKNVLEQHMAFIFGTAKMVGAGSNPFSKESLESIREIKATSGFADIGIANSEGIAYLASGKEIQVENEVFFKTAMDGKKYFATSEISQMGDNPVFIFAAPLKVASDKGGILFAISKSEDILKSTEIKILNLLGSGLIFDAKGMVIGKTAGKDVPIWEQFDHQEGLDASIQEMKETISKKEGGSLNYAIDGEERIGAFKPIGIQDLYLMESIKTTNFASIVSIIKTDKEIAKGLIFLIAIILVLIVIIISLHIYYREKTSDMEKNNLKRLEEDNATQETEELRLSNESFKIATSNAKDVIFSYDVKTKKVMYVSQNNIGVLEFSGVETMLENIPDSLVEHGYIDEEYVEDYVNCFGKILSGEVEAKCIYKAKINLEENIWVRLKLTNIFDFDGKPVRAIGIAEDITDEKERELRYVQERQFGKTMMREAVQAYEVEILSGKILGGYINGDKADNVLEGRSYNDIFKNNQEIIHLEDYRNIFEGKATLGSIVLAYNNGERELSWEYRIKDKDNVGRWIWRLLVIHLVEDPDTGEPRGFAYIKNINNQKKQEIELRELADRDSLTGAYNRLATEKYITKIMKEGEGQTNAFFIIDIDNFKNINDSFGHSAGDDALKKVVDCIKMLHRDKDIVGRIGGDEFVVFMQDVKSMNMVERKARRTCANVKKALAENESMPEGIKISLSIGISICPEHGNTFEELYKNADRALYMAKAKGKDQYAIFGDDEDTKHEATEDVYEED